MTDNEIIREATEALEKNLNAGCYVGELLRIIKKQKSEIEKINVYCENLEISQNHLLNECAAARKTAKSEAYREFAEILRTTNSTVENVLNKLLSNDMGRYDHYTDSCVQRTYTQLTRNLHGKQ
jgi:hypothetical protein